MKELKQLLTQNDFEAFQQALLTFEGNENLQGGLHVLITEFGVTVAVLVSDLARQQDTAFWWSMSCGVWSFSLHFVDGAERSGLFMLKNALRHEPNNTRTLEGILDYYFPPEIVLTDEEAHEIAAKILKLDPANERAKKIVSERK